MNFIRRLLSTRSGGNDMSAVWNRGVPSGPSVASTGATERRLTEDEEPRRSESVEQLGQPPRGRER